MKQIAEFLPIALFFIVYQLKGQSVSLGSWEYTFDGIYTATGVLMATTVLQVAVTWAVTRQLEKRLLWLLLAVLVFGASQFIGDRNLMERTLGRQIHLPKQVWTRLNLLWVGNFLIVGALNLFVAYGFSEETWVSYKLYSAIGFTLLLTILTALLISPHLKDSQLTDK